MQLSDLYKEDYNLSKLCAMHQYTWTNGQVFTMANPRPTNAFLYITDARVTINTKNGAVFYDAVENMSVSVLVAGQIHPFKLSVKDLSGR